MADKRSAGILLFREAPGRERDLTRGREPSPARERGRDPRRAPNPGQDPHPERDGGLTQGQPWQQDGGLTQGQGAQQDSGLTEGRDPEPADRRDGRPGIEVLLGHMGGPFWARRDAGAWSVVKGEYGPDEPARDAARREFREELGLPVPEGEWLPLGDVRQSGGKLVTVWAVEGDLDPGLVVPGTFTMEWPKGSGRLREFPEIDRAAWLDLALAREKIVAAQRVFLDRLAEQRG